MLLRSTTAISAGTAPRPRITRQSAPLAEPRQPLKMTSATR